MTDRLEPAPKGGVPSMDEAFDAAARGGAPKPEQAKVAVPPWFKRLGPTTYTIDTGFGIVTCRTLGFLESETLRRVARQYAKTSETPMAVREAADSERATAMEGYITSLSVVAVFVESIISLPETWRLDRPALGGKVGDPFPPLSAVQGAQKPMEVKDAFFALLPPSLAVQMTRALDFMAIPPMNYEVVTGATDPS